MTIAKIMEHSDIPPNWKEKDLKTKTKTKKPQKTGGVTHSIKKITNEMQNMSTLLNTCDYYLWCIHISEDKVTHE